MSPDTVGRPMEILLIEDSVTDAGIAIGALRDGGFNHRLSYVCDGEEAMQFLHKEGRFRQAPRPDLILLDLSLPKKDGREVLEEIRADESLKSIPVVIVSASKAHEDRVRSENLRVDEYLVKPFDLDKFVALIRELKQFWHAGVVLPMKR